MIIVEGPDLVGKTTLCKKLVEATKQCGTIYSHFSRLPDSFDRYWGYVDRMSRWVVQDRFHMSEIVYARMRGDETDLCPETYRLVDAKLRQLGALTVIITAEDDLIRERYVREEMYGLEQVFHVNALFKDVRNADWDLRIHCTKDQPFADDKDAQNIVDLWHKRQSILQTTLDCEERKL